jgi:hypothetical protein
MTVATRPGKSLNLNSISRSKTTFPGPQVLGSISRPCALELAPHSLLLFPSMAMYWDNLENFFPKVTIKVPRAKESRRPRFEVLRKPLTFQEFGAKGKRTVQPRQDLAGSPRLFSRRLVSALLMCRAEIAI